MEAALAYVEWALRPLFDAFRAARTDVVRDLLGPRHDATGRTGTTGTGSRHPVVWDVPYAEFLG